MVNKKSNGSDLVTKDYLSYTLDVKFGEFEEKMKSFIVENNSAIFSRIDPLLSELENSRIDREYTTEKLEDHEARIKKLEQS